ncbi:glycerol-3-phosphate acyltransferase [Synergistales bacterium]|nr:glycerol-3-phosphate acyltransferase [Synergistales bacterium]
MSGTEYYIDAACWLAFGYLMGSLPTGFVLVKVMMGEDVRHFGSGNIGATNVGRVLGKKWAVITALIDMLKGGAAVLLATAFGVTSGALLALIGVFSVIGHDYPVWIGFKGGKGVATTFGVIAFYNFFNPLPAIIGGIAWFAVREASRIVSISSIIGALVAALALPICGAPVPYYASALFLAALAAWRHKDNIKRIIAGTESKVKRMLFKD